MERTIQSIPDKLFYKAAEVCQITDTQPYVLRFWESEFPQLASEKNRSGQRVYRRSDIELVLRIKKLLNEEEYTIAGARKAIDEGATTIVEPAPAPRTRGRKAAPPAAEIAEPTEPAAPASHATTATAVSRASLFGETHVETPVEPPPVQAIEHHTEEANRYRALYEETLASLNDLRERNRRLAAHLSASIET